jgi:hypothetical protein
MAPTTPLADALEPDTPAAVTFMRLRTEPCGEMNAAKSAPAVFILTGGP